MRLPRISLVAAVLTVVTALAVTAAPAPGSPEGGNLNIFPTTGADVVAPGPPLSLREAISRANSQPGPDTIQLDATVTYVLDLCGGGVPDDTNAAGDLDYTAADNLYIDGFGATIVQECAGERVLHSTSSVAPVYLFGVTITGGDISARSGVEGLGGGLRTAGPLTLERSRVVDNVGQQGGGIFATDQITVIDSLIADNTATQVYGGLYGNDGLNGIQLTRSAVVRNSAPVGSALFTAFELVTHSSTITANSGADTAVIAEDGVELDQTLLVGNDAPIAQLLVINNFPSSAQGSILGACNIFPGNIVSLGRNVQTETTCGLTETTDQTLAEGDLLLGALAPAGLNLVTEVRVPQAGSPLLQAIPANECDPNVDQRSVDRPQNGSCEIGPVEVEVAPDGMVKGTIGAYDGAFVFGGTTNQTVTTTRRRGQPAPFTVRVVNRSDIADDVVVTAPAGTPRFAVRYLVGTTDVTGQVTGAGYTFSDVPAGGRRQFTVRITPKGSAPIGAQYLSSVRVRSGAVGLTAKDTVGARVRVIR